MNTATLPRRHVATGCYTCIFRQVSGMADLLGLSDAQSRALYESTMEFMLQTHGTDIAIQHVARHIMDRAYAIADLPPDHDPYNDIKRHSNDLALQYVPTLQAAIDASASPLETAVRIAAAGNIIDFGAVERKNMDIRQELESIDQRGFGIYDYEEFVRRLAAAGTLLYLCDNAGEIVLDQLFVRQIRKEFPNLDVFCAVREAPVINDALMEDALATGLDRVATVLSSGSMYPGTLPEETSAEFRRLYDKADLIISKGQGNFETLLHADTDRIFFILRIKCEMMAAKAGTALGNLVLMQNRPPA